MTFEPPRGCGADLAVDPLAAEWGDPAWQAARLAEIAAEWASTEHDPDEPTPSTAADAAVAGAVHEVIVDELSGAARDGRRVIAQQYRLLAELVAHADADPDPWVGPDPTLDPAWIDPRDRSVGRVRADRRAFAVRAAVLDAAVRLQLAEVTVQSRARYAAVLAERCPRVWNAFLEGEVPEQNAVCTAQLAETLPADDATTWAAFDEGALVRASRATPGKFRVSARALRERVHAESIERRHRRAADERRVWVAPELDGMATLTAVLPADRAYAAWNRITAAARQLVAAEVDAETTPSPAVDADVAGSGLSSAGHRTLAQTRADVLADLLTDAVTPATADVERVGGSGSAATVAVTVPALTLLGRGDEPATLEGYGPIDRDTALRLAGGATSWVRILTHPVTGVPVTLDRTTYRVPTALRRWAGVLHPTCVGPGCTRLARDCDLDHAVEWRHGGATDLDNLAPECEHHHQVKTESRWDLRRDPLGGWFWISPTGYVSEPDPPPF
jgi:hypothetical protein